MRCLSYDERLQKRGLPRLELRQLHLDLIFCNKIVSGLVCVNFKDVFEFGPTLSTRVMLINCSSLDVRQNYYTERVINLWNSLPPLSFTSLSSFRRTICNVDSVEFIMRECQCLATFSSSFVLLLFVMLCRNFWAHKDEWMNRIRNVTAFTDFNLFRTTWVLALFCLF